jgi:hypothetical protein
MFVGACGAIPQCIAGSASLDPPGITGSYQMWIKGPALTITGGPSDFTINMGTSNIFLNVMLGSGGSMGDLLATVTLTDLFGGKGPVPTFDGTFTTVSSTGSFASVYSPGTTGTIDFTVQLGKHAPFGPMPVGGTTGGYISSGEVVAPTSVPEPTGLALLGTGVLGVAGLIRRNHRLQ